MHIINYIHKKKKNKIYIYMHCILMYRKKKKTLWNTKPWAIASSIINFNEKVVVEKLMRIHTKDNTLNYDMFD